MLSKLERLLDSIDPGRTLDGVARHVDEAVNSFPSGLAQVTSGTEFRNQMVRFWRHLQPRMLGFGPESLPDCTPHEWEHCQRTLNAIYATKNGWKTALEISLTGVEGGHYDVLKRFARNVLEEYTEKLITSGVRSFWSGLSIDERLAAAEEYVAKFADVLPPAYSGKPAAELHESLPGILQQHPRRLRRLRQIGRR